MEINPILLRYIRSELRLSKFLPMLIFVVILYSLTVLSFYQAMLPMSEMVGMGQDKNKSLEARSAMVACLSILTIQICLLAAAGLKISFFYAKLYQSGILDFHRISPLSSYKLALGFLLGIPLRQVVLVILGIPFAVFISLHLPSASTSLILLNYLHIFAIAFCLYAVVLNAVVAIKNSSWAALGIPFIFSQIILLRIQDLFAIPYNFFLVGKVEKVISLNFYNYELNSFSIWLIHYLPVFAFAFFSAARLLDKNFNTILGRKASFLFYIYLIFISIGYLYKLSASVSIQEIEHLWWFFMPYSFVGIIFILSINIPSRIRYIRACVKERYSQSKLSIWSDYSPSNLYFYLFVAFHFLFILLIQVLGIMSVPSTPEFFQSFIASTLFCLICYQLLRLYKIRYEANHVSIYLALFSFLYFILPLILAIIFLGPLNGPSIPLSFIAKLSPFMLFTPPGSEGIIEVFAIHTIAFLVLYLLTKNEEAKIKKSLTVSNKTKFITANNRTQKWK